MEFYKVLAIVMICVNCILMALTAYCYHFQRVRKLERTRLHYIMLWLLQLCLLFMIVYQVMVFSYPITYSDDHGFTKTEIIVLHTQTVIFALHWSLNNVAHTTYTTYYWILVK